MQVNITAPWSIWDTNCHITMERITMLLVGKLTILTENANGERERERVGNWTGELEKKHFFDHASLSGGVL